MATTYGDITKISPKGASKKTASQDGLSSVGVEASQALVTVDIDALNKLKTSFEKVGKDLKIHPALIAAIASRESRAGKLLKSTNGYGDGGQGYGIMQIDVKTSGIDGEKYAWDSEDHIEQAVKEILIKMIVSVQKKFPSWTAEEQLQGGIAAYNFGLKNVQTVDGVDIGTTGGDYSNDVIARAQYLITKYKW